jgi:nicotinamidase-related amidase
MSLSSTDNGLLTPSNCAVIFIDHQPQMFFSIASMDRQDLLNNLLVLAKSAKIFHVPVVLTAVISTVFSGRITQQLPNRIFAISRKAIMSAPAEDPLR